MNYRIIGLGWIDRTQNQNNAVGWDVGWDTLDFVSVGDENKL